MEIEFESSRQKCVQKRQLQNGTFRYSVHMGVIEKQFHEFFVKMKEALNFFAMNVIKVSRIFSWLYVK